MSTFFSRSSCQCFDCGKDRLGLQNHSVAATEWPIVYDVMLIGGPLPQIVGLDVDQSSITCSPQNPTIDHFTKEVRKDRNDIEA